MKEYLPFDINYWLSIKENSLLNNKGKTSSEIDLENILENRQPHNSFTENALKKHNSKDEDLLETIIEERRKFLVKSIGQLDFFHQERIHINSELKYKIDYAIMYYNNLIYDLDLWPRGYNSMIEKRRIHLEKICNTLEQEKRQEKTNCWSDIITVTRDLRVLLKEYVELMIRKRIVQNK